MLKLKKDLPEASLGMTSLGGAGGGQILTAVTDPVSCNVKTERLGRLERREEIVEESADSGAAGPGR